MSQGTQTIGLVTPRHSIQRIIMIGAAIFAVAAAAPSAAYAHGSNISFSGLNFDKDEDLLEQLIELDADDIEDIREEMADAREDIADAIHEIDEAREEVKAAPGGAVILKVALSTASSVVTKATGKAFREVRSELNEAESELETIRSDVGEAEYTETTLAISVIREAITELEVALSELTDAMRA